MKSSFQNGFTLLEVLIAISVFAAVSIMAYGGLSTVIDTKHHVEKNSDAFSQVQKFFLLLRQDLMQASSRPVRDEFGDHVPAFYARPDEDKTLFSLTRNGVTDLALHHSLPKRISYQLQDKQLSRISWPVLDRLQNTEAREVVLLEGINSLDIKYLSDDWISYWPENTSRLETDEIPRALRITLDIQGIGLVQRLLPVTL